LVSDTIFAPTPQTRLHWKTRAFAALVILSNAFGNFSLTWGMKHRGEALTLSPLSYIQAIFTPWVALGIVLLIVWMLSRMALLSWADLSYVLPVTALGYVANALLGRLFLHEHISAGRWAGTLMIVAGTTLVGLGNPQGKGAQP
jgi:drug/metabolite transporter (DMT)-like permease